MIRALGICAATFYQWLGCKHNPLPSENRNGERVVYRTAIRKWLKQTRRMV